MKTSTRPRVFLIACGFASAAGVYGCYPYDCRDLAECRLMCTADPADGRPEDGCGVFVSSTRGDDGSPGTVAQPVRTLQKAITLAQAGSKRVYACAEVFDEAVEIPSGVEVWGGLDCSNGWAYVGATAKTTIAPGPGIVPLRLVPGNGAGKVADVRAQAASAVEPGAASIAAMVMPDAVVDFLRVELVAGDGADGTAGAPGGHGPAEAGIGGSPGADACTADVVPGAPETVATCGGVYSIGGQGGHGTAAQGGDGATGTPEPVPNPQGFGLGGIGWNSGAPCDPGADGLTGATGANGLGAVGPGKLTLSGWEGAAGQDGGDGLPGQGGGGGGGARGGMLACGASNPQGGASGGAGGSGGCGGKGGKGGGSGGASIGLLSLSHDVAIREATIVTGRGGNGGSGGAGQPRGTPGLGGSGGAPGMVPTWGCAGGLGGWGGDGGHGGGGLGGSSIAIAHIANQPPEQAAVFVETGTAGKGGLGGLPSVSGSAGEDGVRVDTRGFPP